MQYAGLMQEAACKRQSAERLMARAAMQGGGAMRPLVGFTAFRPLSVAIRCYPDARTPSP